jgi:maleylacetate reductase
MRGGARVRPFIHQSEIPRVVFGEGSLAKLPSELERLGVERALVLATPEQESDALRIGADLGARCAGVHARARMHVPRECVRDALDEARRRGADCALAFGGGSTTGLAKALALELDLCIVAVPTTYAGSEMTPIHGITEDGVKRTGRAARVLPRTVIYDPLLTLGLPVERSVTSAFNALAHAVEGLYAEERSPLTDRLAVEGIRSLARALPHVAARPDDVGARSRCLYGAWLCGVVLGTVGMALHHKLCHTLGGSFDLPHAETHTVVLPHVMAYNAGAAPGAARHVARALRGADAAAGLHDLAARLGAPLALRTLGLEERDLERAADLATQAPYYNPRPVERRAIRALLDDAYHGRRPAEARA